MSKIGTASGNSTTEIQIPWTPEIIHYVKEGDNFVRLTVEVAGDGVVTKLNASGLNACGKFEKIGSVNNQTKLRLSNGLIRPKNTTITIENGQATDVDIYGFSVENGNMFVQTVEQTVFDGSGQLITDFSRVVFPNSNQNDKYTITYKNGVTQQFYRDELRTVLSYQRLCSNDSSDFVIINEGGIIRSVDFLPNAQQTYYLQRFAPASGAITTRV